MSEGPRSGAPTISVKEAGDHTQLRPEGRSRGAILVPFIRQGVATRGDDPLLLGHSLFWEVREMCRTLAGLGFDVDVVDLGAVPPARYPDYQAILSVHDGLWRYAPGLPPTARKIMWMTGSHPEFQNRREIDRIRALERRRDCICQPRRQISNLSTELASIEMADCIALVGNEVTKSTYPRAWHHKIDLVAVSAEAPVIKSGDRLTPHPRELVWFSASGAVLKGLDILLDLSGSRDWPILHVVGPVEQEEDFFNVYHAELEGHPRIRRHGFRTADDPVLSSVLDRCAAVVHPSASEGMSGAVALCLQAGLYPIISRASGIDLPAGCGRQLETCSHDEIATAVEAVLAMDDTALRTEIQVIQTMALRRFSRVGFTQRLSDLFGRWLAG